MGTSQSLKPSAKKNPEWGNFTNYASSLIRNDDYSDDSIEPLFDKYSSAKNELNNPTIFGNSGIDTIGKLFDFFTDVRSIGLLEKLKQMNFTSIDIQEIINYMINYCTNNSTDFDTITAKNANKDLLEEIFIDLKSIDEIEIYINNLNETSVKEILIKYFGFYIFEDMSRILYEKLYQKYPNSYNKFFKEIKKYIFTKLEHLDIFFENLNISQINSIIKKIKKEVFKIFLPEVAS